MERYKVLRFDLFWEVGDGDVIRFWLDKWLEDGKRVELRLETVPFEDLQNSLASYSSQNVSWDSIPFC